MAARGVVQTRETMLDECSTAVMNEVDTALSVVTRYADAADKGTLDRGIVELPAKGAGEMARFPIISI